MSEPIHVKVLARERLIETVAVYKVQLGDGVLPPILYATVRSPTGLFELSNLEASSWYSRDILTSPHLPAIKDRILLAISDYEAVPETPETKPQDTPPPTPPPSPREVERQARTEALTSIAASNLLLARAKGYSRVYAANSHQDAAKAASTFLEEFDRHFPPSAPATPSTFALNAWMPISEFNPDHPPRRFLLWDRSAAEAISYTSSDHMPRDLTDYTHFAVLGPP